MSLFTVIPQGPFESKCRKQLSLSSCGWVLVLSAQFIITTEIGEFEAALHGCKSEFGELDAKVHGCMLDSREHDAALQGGQSKIIRWQFGESSRRGIVAGTRDSWRAQALKGQAFCEKSGALLDRSVVSSHLVGLCVCLRLCPTCTFVLFSSFVGVGVGGLNACGFMHGVVMHDNSLEVREISCCVVGHRNSCNSHTDELRVETKALSTSTRCKVRRVLLKRSLSLFSRRHQSCMLIRGQAFCLGTCWAGHFRRKQLGLGYGCSGVPFEGRIFFLPSAQQETWLRRDRTTQRGLSLVLPRAPVRIRMGKAPLSGHTLDSGAGHCLPVLWRAIAPLMKPWCAEGEVPTAANLNLYRRWNWCVGWHRDDETLFGEYGDAKLIVSLSLGGSAVFRWRRQSCPSDEGRSCRLDHGDILVMDGQCQDEFLHRTDPGRKQERINVTFLWVRQHVSSCPLFRTGVACCLPTCAQGLSVPVMGNFGFGVFWAFWLLFGVLCIWGMTCLASLPVVYKTWVPIGVPPSGHAFGRRSVEASSLQPLERMFGSS